LEKVACGAFSDIAFVSGGKKRGLVYLRKGRLPWRVATPG